MTLDVAPEPVPLLSDPRGVVRVGSTRVTLDTVVAAFATGATAEEIAHQYPSVELADIYAVITSTCATGPKSTITSAAANAKRARSAPTTRHGTTPSAYGNGCSPDAPAEAGGCCCWPLTRT